MQDFIEVYRHEASKKTQTIIHKYGEYFSLLEMADEATDWNISI
jgi:hypothetical protein